jgi:hypothetical protein
MWLVVVGSGLGHGILTSIASAFLGFFWLGYLGISARTFWQMAYLMVGAVLSSMAI